MRSSIVLPQRAMVSCTISCPPERERHGSCRLRSGRVAEAGRRIVVHMKRTRTTSTANSLMTLSLFSDCTVDQLAPLLPHADIITLPVGTVLDRSGTWSRQIIGILDGYVSGFDPDRRLFTLGPGDHIGAAEVFSEGTHSATYTTSTTTTLVAFFGPIFRAAARRLPGVVERSVVPQPTDRACRTFSSLSPVA